MDRKLCWHDHLKLCGADDCRFEDACVFEKGR